MDEGSRLLSVCSSSGDETRRFAAAQRRAQRQGRARAAQRSARRRAQRARRRRRDRTGLQGGPIHAQWVVWVSFSRSQTPGQCHGVAATQGEEPAGSLCSAASVSCLCCATSSLVPSLLVRHPTPLPHAACCRAIAQHISKMVAEHGCCSYPYAPAVCVVSRARGFLLVWLSTRLGCRL